MACFVTHHCGKSILVQLINSRKFAAGVVLLCYSAQDTIDFATTPPASNKRQTRRKIKAFPSVANLTDEDRSRFGLAFELDPNLKSKHYGSECLVALMVRVKNIKLGKGAQTMGQDLSCHRLGGCRCRVSGYFYKAVVQPAVLYGCKTWTLDEAKLNALQGFHNRITRSIAHGRGTWNPQTGEWSYPHIATAREKAGIFLMEHYLHARQRSFVDQVSVWPIAGLRRQVTQQPDFAPAVSGGGLRHHYRYRRRRQVVVLLGEFYSSFYK